MLIENNPICSQIVTDMDKEKQKARKQHACLSETTVSCRYYMMASLLSCLLRDSFVKFGMPRLRGWQF